MKYTCVVCESMQGSKGSNAVFAALIKIKLPTLHTSLVKYRQGTRTTLFFKGMIQLELFNNARIDKLFLKDSLYGEGVRLRIFPEKE